MPLLVLMAHTVFAGETKELWFYGKGGFEKNGENYRAFLKRYKEKSKRRALIKHFVSEMYHRGTPLKYISSADFREFGLWSIVKEYYNSNFKLAISDSGCTGLRKFRVRQAYNGFGDFVKH